MDDIANDIELAAKAADLLKAVAHPLRLRIVALLATRPHNVSELAALLDVSQSNVSHQLRLLRMKELVGVTRADGFATYRLVEEHLRDMLGCVSNCCQQGGSAS